MATYKVKVNCGWQPLLSSQSLTWFAFGQYKIELIHISVSKKVNFVQVHGVVFDPTVELKSTGAVKS